VTPVEFRGDLWRQKTRVPGVSCGVVYVILRLAVLVELRLVTDTDTDTDRQTDTGLWLVPRMHSMRGKNALAPIRRSPGGVVAQRYGRRTRSRGRGFNLRPGCGCVRRLWASCSHPVAPTPTLSVSIISSR